MKYLKIVLFCLVLVGLYFFLKLTDWDRIFALIRSIGWKSLWLLFFTFLSGVFGSIGWHYCILRDRSKVTFIDLFLIRHLGETIGVLNPTGIVAGDGMKVNLLSERGVDTEASLASIIVSRTLTMLSHFGVFIGAAILIDFGFSLRVIAAFLVFFLVVYLIAKAFRHVLNRLLTDPDSRIGKLWVTIKAQIRILMNFDRRAMLIAFLFFAVHWVMGGAEFLLILRFLGVHINLAEAVLIDSGVGFFKAVGILVPGQLGIEEYGNKYMLETVGVENQEVWVTASILRRARQVFWILFGIGVYLVHSGRAVRA
jgi:glycosyltransferase 2 family protein